MQNGRWGDEDSRADDVSNYIAGRSPFSNFVLFFCRHTSAVSSEQVKLADNKWNTCQLNEFSIVKIE
jgi:hypothetical protein